MVGIITFIYQNSVIFVLWILCFTNYETYILDVHTLTINSYTIEGWNLTARGAIVRGYSVDVKVFNQLFTAWGSRGNNYRTIPLKTPPYVLLDFRDTHTFLPHFYPHTNLTQFLQLQGAVIHCSFVTKSIVAARSVQGWETLGWDRTRKSQKKRNFEFLRKKYLCPLLQSPLL